MASFWTANGSISLFTPFLCLTLPNMFSQDGFQAPGASIPVTSSETQGTWNSQTLRLVKDNGQETCREEMREGNCALLLITGIL